MTEKTLDLYNMVMAKIIEVLNRIKNGGEFSVQLMISDFEAAILTSMETTSPMGELVGAGSTWDK